MWFRIRGTAAIAEVVLLRDCEPYRRWRATSESLEVHDSVPSADAVGHFFYLRMQQVDTNLCWSSPIWVDG